MTILLFNGRIIVLFSEVWFYEKKNFMCTAYLLFHVKLVPCFCLGGCRKETYTVEFYYNDGRYETWTPLKRILVENGSLIENLEHTPFHLSIQKSKGLKFDGWYQEKECINPWAFYTDKVYCDIKLYSKWSKIE